MAALTSQKWFCDSSTYSSVAAWAALTIYAAGALVRQLATPAVGSERVFVCVVAGTSGAAEPSWTTTQGAKTTDGTVTWQEVTGKAAVNGDTSETFSWADAKAQTSAINLGTIIKRNNGASLQICTTSGTTGSSEPSFSNTAGATTTDNTVTWTSLGAPGNYGALAAPWARLNLGMASGAFPAASDRVYFSKNHAETQAAAMTYTSIGSGVTFLGFDPTGGVNPPATAATGGSATTTGANAITIAQSSNTTQGKITGLTLNCGTGSSQADLTMDNAGFISTENCTFNLVNTAAASRIRCNSTSSNNDGQYHINPTFTFANTGQSITLPQARCIIKGGSTGLTGSVPAQVFVGSGVAGAGSLLRIMGHDYSACTGIIFDASGTWPGIADFENCKLNASSSFPNSSSPIGSLLKMHNCDSGATNYNYIYKSLNGVAVSDIAITRVGGAALNGVPLSWHITTPAGATFDFPFETEEIGQLNLATGSSKTVTIFLESDSTLTNADFWAEVEYLGNASFPISSIVSSRAAYLATPVTLTTDSSTWNGTAKTNKYKIVLTLTPQMAYPFKVRAFCGKASVDVWVDPRAVIA